MEGLHELTESPCSPTEYPLRPAQGMVRLKKDLLGVRTFFVSHTQACSSLRHTKGTLRRVQDQLRLTRATQSSTELSLADKMPSWAKKALIDQKKALPGRHVPGSQPHFSLIPDPYQNKEDTPFISVVACRVGRKKRKSKFEKAWHLFSCYDVLRFQSCQNFPEIRNFWLVETVLKILVFRSIASLWDGVSKLRVVALHNKNQSIGLDEYSRLVVYFLTLGQYLT